MKFRIKKFKDWFNQAERTLNSIKNDIKGEDYNWACFKAHQASEFALKSFLYGVGMQTYGHSIKKLASRIEKFHKKNIFDRNCLIQLDKYYIPTRYADAFPSGSPYSFYSKKDGDSAYECATSILQKVKLLKEKYYKK